MHSPFLRHHEDKHLDDHYHGAQHPCVREAHQFSSRDVSKVKLSLNTRLSSAKSMGAYMAFGDDLVECTIHCCGVLANKSAVAI